MSPLSPAPDLLVDAHGAPNAGVFAGRMRDTAVDRLEAPMRHVGATRLFAEKRWHYACVFTPSLVVAGAVVNLGYLANAFVYVFDRTARRVLVERSIVAPARAVELDDLACEARGRLRWLRSHVLIEASRLGGRFAAWVPGALSIEIRFHPETAPEPLTAVCPLPGAKLCVTQKTAGVRATGEVRIGPGGPMKIEGLACLDYSHGLLGRETQWRWASACGTAADGRLLAVNLVEGHNDFEVTENAVWIGGAPQAVGRARFDFDRRAPEKPWRIHTNDGRVDLRFEPEGVRRQDINLGLIVSRYAQPIGTFSGVIVGEDGERVAVERLPGVTEDHFSRW